MSISEIYKCLRVKRNRGIVHHATILLTCEKPLAQGTNQIAAGFGELRLLKNLEKIKGRILQIASAGILSNNNVNRKDI